MATIYREAEAINVETKHLPAFRYLHLDLYSSLILAFLFMPSFVKNLVHWNIQKVQMPIQPPDDLCEVCVCALIIA